MTPDRNEVEIDARYLRGVGNIFLGLAREAQNQLAVHSQNPHTQSVLRGVYAALALDLGVDAAESGKAYGPNVDQSLNELKDLLAENRKQFLDAVAAIKED